MSIANRILSVLVLIASITAIILAIMLFNAREEVVAGRESMAQAIADNSNKLAQTSTANPAKVKIAAEDMSVAQGNGSVADAVKKFDDVTKAILAQRDMLAKQLMELTSILAEGETGKITSADLANVKTNKEKFEEIKKNAEAIVNLYTQTRNAYIKTVKDFEETLKMQGIDSDALNPKNPQFETIDAALEKMKTKIKAMDTHILIDFNASVPNEDRFKVTSGDMNGENYIGYLKDQKAKLETLKSVYNQQLAEIANLKAEVEKLTAERDALIAQKKQLQEGFVALHAMLKNDTAEVDGQKITYDYQLKDGFNFSDDADNKALLDKLQGAFTDLINDYVSAKASSMKLAKANEDLKKKLESLAGSAGPAAATNKKEGESARAAAMTPVQTAALSTVEAKITYVNAASGFVVLNIGSTTKIDTKDANGKKQKVQLVLPQKAIMTVATSLNPENAKFVCKLQVYKVEANQSLANILPGGNMPKVGDVVYFSAADIINSTPADVKK